MGYGRPELISQEELPARPGDYGIEGQRPLEPTLALSQSRGSKAHPPVSIVNASVWPMPWL